MITDAELLERLLALNHRRAAAQWLPYTERWPKDMMCAMEEVLSKTRDPTIPLQEQEYFALSLVDEANPRGTRYCVRQAHASWSEIDGQIMFDDEETEYFRLLGEAKRRYNERRSALEQRGFIYSDMDVY